MAKVSDKDKGFKRLAREVFGKNTSPAVEVGILAKDGAKSHGEGTTVADIATWNHYGTSNPDGSVHIPARPFLTIYVDGQQDRLRTMLEVLMKSVVAGKRTPQQALDTLGAKMVGEIQAAIPVGFLGAYPENAPSTIAAKGSATPLIDEGLLRSSISFKTHLDYKPGGKDGDT